MTVSSRNIFYKQAADLYVRPFAKNPETYNLSFSEEDPNTLEPVFKVIPSPSCAIDEDHRALCGFFNVNHLTELGLRNIYDLDRERFIGLASASFQAKYLLKGDCPCSTPLFSLEELEESIKTSFIEYLNDEWALISKRTVDVKGLSEEEQKRHCQIVAFRVYHFVAENCCPNFKGVYDEVRASLDKLYEKQSIRLLRYLVPKECENEADNDIVKLHVQEELKKRFLNFNNEAVVAALETEIQNYRSSFLVKSPLYSTPEECLNAWIDNHWKFIGEKEVLDLSELAQRDVQREVLQNCKAHFLEHFPEDSFSEAILPRLYKDRVIYSLLSKRLFGEVHLEKGPTVVGGVSSVQQEIEVLKIRDKVLSVLEQYWGKEKFTVSEIKEQIHLKLDDLYINTVREYSIFKAKYDVRALIDRNIQLPSLYIFVTNVIDFVKKSFPRDRVWAQVEAQEKMRVAVEFIKAKILEELVPYKNKFVSFREEDLPVEKIELEINKVKVEIIDLVNKEYEELTRSDRQVDRDLSQCMEEIERFLSGQFDLMKKIEMLPIIKPVQVMPRRL